MMKRATRHSRRGRASKRAKSDEHAADTRDDPGEDEEDSDVSLWLSSVSVCEDDEDEVSVWFSVSVCELMMMMELMRMMKTLSLYGCLCVS